MRFTLVFRKFKLGQKFKNMKNLNRLLAVMLFLGFSNLSLAQTVKLNELHNFDKIILEGDIQGVDVASQHVDHPSILIEGAKKENVSASVEAGVLHLKINKAEDALVHVFNARLKRIEGPAEMEIHGVDYIGSKGRYLVTGRGPSFRPPLVDVPHGDFDFHFDYNFDREELAQIEADVRVEIRDRLDEWRKHMHDFRYDFQYEGREFSEEMKEALREAKRELRRGLKELDDQF